jgi:predicted lipid-binding transport protein (Tim44 family)
MIAFVATAVALSPLLAEAGRLGGGRSAGSKRVMTRAAPAPQQAAPHYSQQANTPQQYGAPQQPQRSNTGKILAGAAAGAAVGGVAGYMMGKAANEQAAPNQQVNTAPQQTPAGREDVPLNNAAAAPATPASSSSNWLSWLLIGGLLLAGFMWFKRRQQFQPRLQGMASNAGNWQQAPSSPDRVYRMGNTTQSGGALPAAPARLADGTETAAFLRQARASFLHMQAMNSPEQLEELRKYLTPELFAELQGDIAANRDLAEFPQLDVELTDTGYDDGKLFASARFFGRVSESLNTPATPFEEYWHFIKPRAEDPRWLLAGIQQA